MEAFNILTSKAAPLMLANIDTDIISPMKRLLANGDELGKYAFEPLRFVDGNGDKGIPSETFSLNLPEYENAKIMIVGANFGCGSSRETAAEGIAEMGVRCIIGSSFGSIFLSNCFQSGILPIVLTEEKVSELAKQTKDGVFTVDLENLVLTTPNGEKIEFTVDPFKREKLLKGLDDVSVILQMKDKIDAFEKKDCVNRPWVYQIKQ